MEEIKKGTTADMLPAMIRETGRGEKDEIAFLANVSALLFQVLTDVSWAGFYRLIGNELVLGPFQGKVACSRIQMGKGVCGTSAEKKEVLVVDDVHAFPGHIACDSESASEIVLPLYRKDGSLFGVLDLDSTSPARFPGLRGILEECAGALREFL